MVVARGTWGDRGAVVDDNKSNSERRGTLPGSSRKPFPLTLFLLLPCLLLLLLWTLFFLLLWTLFYSSASCASS